MRAVLDTNVLVSGMLWRGTPEKIVRAWRDGKYTLILTRTTLEELRRVLSYPRIHMPEEMIQAWVELLLENSLLIEPKVKINRIKEDPSDNRFLEAALAGGADFLVSGDKHLLAVKQFHDFKIVKPAQFYIHL